VQDLDQSRKGGVSSTSATERVQVLDRPVKRGSTTNLKESVGRHPTSSALLILCTQHPQFFHFIPYFVRLEMIKMYNISQSAKKINK